MQRIAELNLDNLTPEQARVRDILTDGPRGGVGGPFKVLLHQPALAEATQALGLYLRNQTSLPRRLIELTILFETRFWRSEYPWYAHKPMAIEAGLGEDVIDAMRNRYAPPFTQKDETALYALLTELHDTRRISDATYSQAVAEIGDLAVLDAISLAGYYALISMIANAYELKLPPENHEELTG